VSVHTLQVLDAPAQIGVITYDSLNEQFSFSYSADWVDSEHAYSISPHIPIHGTPAQHGTVRRFLENLLPEGRALDIVATTHRVSKNNIHGLIRELGQETSGALSFVAEEGPRAPGATTRREITRAELQGRITERTQLPFSVWDGRVRMSIAGYQDKLPIYMEHDRMYLVEGALASTHILKPEPPDARFFMLVANEHFSMCLASRLGISAAPVSILRLPDPVLVVERFDRARQGSDSVRRLHVVDGCQALDLPVSYKYERNFGSGRDVRDIRDGVSFERLFTISEQCVRKAATRLALVRWALLQFLLGNSDAHGKNLSFFCTPAGLTLAPCYDLVSVVQYEQVDHELAMAYGDEFVLDNIRPYDWAEFARSTETPRGVLVREMKRMGAAAPELAAELATRAEYIGEERSLVARIATFVARQARTLLDMAPAVLRVKLE
jgi:serine/threonine-protein kinase HipA